MNHSNAWVRRGRWILLVWLLVVGGVPALWAQHGPPTAEEAFALAFNLYEDRFYDQAADAFGSFLSAYPDHPQAPEALFYQAQAALANGQEEAATRLFLAFEDLFPEHPFAFQARLALGSFFFEGQDYRRAIEILEVVVREEPPADVASKAYYWMGESALNLNRFGDALRYLEASAQYRETETAPLAQYAIGFVHAEQNRPSEAADAFEQLAIRYPNHPLSRSIGLGLAESYYELNDYERAIEEIKRRLPRLDGELEQRAVFLMAESYNQLRDQSNAIVQYRRFVESYPDSPYIRRAIYGLGWNYYFEGAYQWAAEQFAKVREGHTDELAHEAAYYQAVNLYRSRRLDRAAQTFAEVVEQWPDGDLADDAQYELGLTLYELRQWEPAEEAFTRLVENYPDSQWRGQALRMQGESRVAQGEYLEALDPFDEAIDLETAPPELRQQVEFQRAWLLYNEDRFDEAAPAFLRLYEQDPTGSMAPDALFWAAESAYQTGQYDQAEQLFKRYINDHPTHKQVGAAHYALGWSYFKDGKYTDAIDYLEHYLNRYSSEGGERYILDARLRLADSYYALKRFDEAIAGYRAVRGDYEDYVLYQIGQSQYQVGESEEAAESFRQLVEVHPYSEWREEALYRIGYIGFENGDYASAISGFETLSQRYPQHPLSARAQYGIGDAYYNMGLLNNDVEQLEEAVSSYRTVLDRYPNSSFVVDAVGGIVFALQALEREEEMDEILEAFIEQNPNSPVVDQIRFKRAEVRFQSGQFEEAITAIERFVEESNNPDLEATAYLYLGLAHQGLDEQEEAETSLRRVVTQYPESPERAEAEQRLGRIYLEQERFDEALRIYENVSLEGKDEGLIAGTVYGRSMALLGLGRIDEAIERLNEATQADIEGPELSPVRLGLARVYEEQGRIEDAIPLYRKVAQDDFDEVGAEALYRLGELYISEESPYAALEELGKIPVLFAGYDEWVARGFMAQARAYLLLEQQGNAVTMYDRVIDEFSGTPYAEEATGEKEKLEL